MTDTTLSFSDRKEVAQYLNRAYSFERYAHITVSIVSVLCLLGLGVWQLRGDAGWEAVVGMFGSSGVIAVSQGRVLYLWNKTADILMGTWSPERGDD